MPAVLVVLAVALPAPPALAAGTSSPTGTATSSTGSSSPTAGLTLLAPPTIAGPGRPFSLRLGVPGGVGRTNLSLGISVYRHIVDPSEFDETLGGTPVGSIIARSDAPIPLSSLSPDAADPQKGVDLSVPVAAGGVSATGTGPFTADLNCSLGSCGGVYPVRLVLTDGADGAVVSRLLTYLVYTDPSADIEPLRFALVVPLALSPTPTSPPDTAAAVTPSSLASLTALMGSLSGSRAAVPVTLLPSPATAAALAADRQDRSRQALSSLVSLTTDPGRQTLCSSFVPVDAGALDTAGLSSEIPEQVHRGAQVLSAIPGLRTSGCAADNAWVTEAPLDAGAITTLATLGYNHLVVAPTAVAGPTSSTTPSRRFTLSGGSAGDAVLSDSDISSRLRSSSRADPALAADQLLAELELDYYEAPNTQSARGVAAVVPAAGAVDPAVITDLLDGLQDNPMVRAVTLATLFSDVPVGGAVAGVTQPSTRRPAVVTGAAGLPARAIKAARLQWTGFSAAVAGSTAGATVAAGLNDMLLGAESQQLAAARRNRQVAHFGAALAAQLALLSVTSREVRLTASAGSVPITVIKSAPYPVKAVLSLTSDKIAFSSANAQAPNTQCAIPVVTGAANTSSVSAQSSVSMQCTFVHGTNAVYVEMQSRVSGDFRLTVTLDSPQGGLQLTSGQLTVRSMSTSAVAIALSAAAAVVLLGWWGRTIWRGRRTRRGAHRRRPATPA
ncbi:MAG TPA: hypothetical protein VNC61_17505 [Acidimicrobiales bacterium]|nr:hypothetical protein [Acidimicrobiales bacterium]